MKHLLSATVLACLSLQTALAAPWTFGRAVDVTPPPAGKTFHHLDASGRRHIAAGEKGVAVVWEDDRDGAPRIYLAHKGYAEEGFSMERQISGAAEAYEPSLTALGDDRFALVWEEDGAVWLRMVRIGDEPVLGPRHRISHRQGAQATLTSADDRLIVVWSEREGRFGRIRAQSVNLNGLTPTTDKECPIDAAVPTDEQLYPAATLVQGRLVVTWEDRRPKHTIIMAAVEETPGGCVFSEPVRISEKPQGPSLPYGAGHGVSRVAVDRAGDALAFAAWADKRNFRNGYDIWGAYYDDETRAFGKNERIQDDFGGLAKQRHASVAGHPSGKLVVAWDDEREGQADLFLSWREEDAWSDDWPISIASGQGQQTNPSLVLDEDANLHLVWIERDEIGGVTRLRYGYGAFTGGLD